MSLHSTGKPATDEEVIEVINAELERGFVGKVQVSLKTSAEVNASGSSRINIWVRTPEIPCGAWPSALEQGRSQQVADEAARFHAQAEAPVVSVRAAIIEANTLSTGTSAIASANPFVGPATF